MHLFYSSSGACIIQAHQLINIILIFNYCHGKTIKGFIFKMCRGNIYFFYPVIMFQCESCLCGLLHNRNLFFVYKIMTFLVNVDMLELYSFSQIVKMENQTGQ